MPKNRLIIAGLLVACLLPQSVLAARAGIVVKKSDGSIKNTCVEFDGETISGLDLLKKSGFNPKIENGFVVSIDGEGDKSAGSLSSTDPFWSYWRWDNTWKFYNAGAGYTKIADGNVDGWEFGRGQSTLPQISFGSICPDRAIEVDTNEQSLPTGAKVESITTNQPSVKSLPTEKATALPETTSSATTSPVIKAEVKSEFKKSLNFPKFDLKNALIATAAFFLGGIVFVLKMFFGKNPRH